MGNQTVWQKAGEDEFEKLAIAVMAQTKKDLGSADVMIKQDAERWVKTEDDEYPLSFNSLCRSFHVDADGMREELLYGKS